MTMSEPVRRPRLCDSPCDIDSEASSGPLSYQRQDSSSRLAGICEWTEPHIDIRTAVPGAEADND
jgi:hypothetical protein